MTSHSRATCCGCCRAGTAYKELLAVDLARLAMKGLLDKTALDPSLIDYVNFGTVIQGVPCCR